MSPQSWLIVGLGWLGTTLAEQLAHDGITVTGTHRSTFTFGRDPFPANEADVILLNTPPLTDLEPARFVETIRTAPNARILFVSSTSVYGSADGEVDEETPPHPETASARWLLAVETALAARFGKRLTIVRPGGLIGGERHPVFFLARRGTVLDDGPVNLVQRDDVIGILRAAAQTDGLPVVNAVAPMHPLKSVYYNDWAKRSNLPAIATRPARGSGRIVRSRHVARIYGDWRVPRLDRL